MSISWSKEPITGFSASKVEMLLRAQKGFDFWLRFLILDLAFV